MGLDESLNSWESRYSMYPKGRADLFLNLGAIISVFLGIIGDGRLRSLQVVYLLCLRPGLLSVHPILQSMSMYFTVQLYTHTKRMSLVYRGSMCSSRDEPRSHNCV